MGLFFEHTRGKLHSACFLVDFHFYYKMTLRSWFGGIEGKKNWLHVDHTFFSRREGKRNLHFFNFSFSLLKRHAVTVEERDRGWQPFLSSSSSLSFLPLLYDITYVHK